MHIRINLLKQYHVYTYTNLPLSPPLLLDQHYVCKYVYKYTYMYVIYKISYIRIILSNNIHIYIHLYIYIHIIVPLFSPLLLDQHHHPVDYIA
jgi:hypothetical protein